MAKKTKQISKTLVTGVMFSALALASIANPSFASAADSGLDLNQLDSVSADEGNKNVGNISITNIDAVFQETNEVPAGSELHISAVVRNGDVRLTDADVTLNVKVTDLDTGKEVGKVESIDFDSANNLFNIKYQTPNTPDKKISFVFSAKLKSNPSVSLEESSDVTLTQQIQTATPTNSGTTNTASNTNTGNIITSDKKDTSDTTDKKDTTSIFDTTDTKTDDTSKDLKVEDDDATKKATNTDMKLEANVLSTKIIGDNRIVVNFDRELFLPDEPIKLVSISSMSTKDNKSESVKVSNVTLGDDKKSLVILTADVLKPNETYKLSINEVIDGKTKKRIKVINGDLTITGFAETFVFLFALLAFLFIIWMKTIRDRKNG